MSTNVSTLNSLFKEIYGQHLNNLVYSNSMFKFEWEVLGYPSKEMYEMHKASLSSLKDKLGL